MERETRMTSVPLELRKVGGDKYLDGLGGVYFDTANPEATQYRLWDKVWERIMPGAFDQALKRPDDVRCLFNHNVDAVLGRSTSKTLTLRTDSAGLRFSCKLPNDVDGTRIAVKIQRGDITGCSMAFIAEDVVWREEGENTYREIRSVKLFDVGPVTFPAYTGTDVSLAKRSHGDYLSARPHRSLADLELDFRLRQMLG